MTEGKQSQNTPKEERRGGNDVRGHQDEEEEEEEEERMIQSRCLLLWWVSPLARGLFFDLILACGGYVWRDVEGRRALRP